MVKINDSKWRSIDNPPEKKRWYDLCFLDVGSKVIRGWWTGKHWDGLRYKGQNIRRWMYCNEDLMHE